MKNFSIAILTLLFVLVVSSVFIIYEGQRGIVSVSYTHLRAHET